MHSTTLSDPGIRRLPGGSPVAGEDRWEGGGVQVLRRVDPVLGQPGLQQRAGEGGGGVGVRGGRVNRQSEAGGGGVDGGLQQVQVLEQRVAGLHEESLLGWRQQQPQPQPEINRSRNCQLPWINIYLKRLKIY